jgi:hypothetical protein
VEFESTGETARLCVRGSPNAYASVVTSDWIDWDTRSNRWLQIQVPNLEFGERTKVLVHSSMGAGGWALLHDEWGAIPGQGPQPQTMDVNAAIPAGSQQILLMFEIVDNVWGDPPEGAEVNLDWIKAGMPGHSILPADAPKPTMPIEGETVGNLPMLGWSAPAGYGANRYSVSLSRDPLFSDASTLTALDSVFGTRLGASNRHREYAKVLGVNMVICDKERRKANEIASMTIIGDVTDMDVVLVDDLCDTAGTLSKAAKLIKDNGARSVRAVCTHPVLSGKAYENIENSVLEELIVCDTIPMLHTSPKIKVLSVAPLMSKAIRNIHEHGSISSLFKLDNSFQPNLI